MIKISKFLVLFFLVIGFASCSDEPGGEADEVIVDSLPANTADRNKVRLERLNSEISARPEAADNYHLRAKVYLDMNEYNAALRDVSSAVARDSTQAEYYYTGMKAFRALNRIPEAVQSGLKAQDLGLQRADFFSDMAELSIIRKDYTNAMAFANLALRQDKFDAEAYRYKGIIFQETGDTARAIGSYQTAIEIEPTMADAYNSLAMIYNDLGEPDVAMTYINSGKRFAPENSMLHYNEGATLQAMGFEDSSRTSYALAISLDSTNYMALYNLGAVYFNAENYERAIPHLAKAERMRPDFPQINLLLGVAYQETGDYERAQKHYERQLQRTPDDAKTEELLSEVKKEINRQ